MHFKRIENIFKLKKIAWAENDCLPWMLLCNPLGARVISQGAPETERAVCKNAGGEEEEEEIVLINSVNVLLPRTIDRTAREACHRAGGSQPMENPAVVCPLSAGRGC